MVGQSASHVHLQPSGAMELLIGGVFILMVIGWVLEETPLLDFLFGNRWPLLSCAGCAAVGVAAAYAKQEGLSVMAFVVMWVIAISSIGSSLQKKIRGKK